MLSWEVMRLRFLIITIADMTDFNESRVCVKILFETWKDGSGVTLNVETSLWRPTYGADRNRLSVDDDVRSESPSTSATGPNVSKVKNSS